MKLVHGSTARLALALALALGVAAPVALLFPGAAAQAAGGAAPKPELRHMQVYRVNELGLEIWVENQPPWETQLSSATGRPTFVAESPPNYHPPTVITYASWPNEKVSTEGMYDMASSAIRRASQNFGISAAASLTLPIREAQYGEIRGYESWFNGKADGVAMDVSVFVGQAPGKFPVAFNVYTVRGKLPSLAEHLRRAWTNVKYLPAGGRK